MKTVYGDLFAYAKASEGCVIIHGCNCRGSFAAGFAGLIRQRYPAAYDRYIEDFTNNRLAPGSCSYVRAGKDLIINACTQDFPGANAVPGYIEACMKNVVRQLTLVARRGRLSYREIFIPAIGCGIGGLVLNDTILLYEQLDKLEQYGITTTLVLME